MTDRRVQRTQAALRAALLELITELPYDKVSVQALVDRANVGRATFYHHYADKEELLLESMSALRDHIRAQIPSSPRGDGPTLLAFALPLLQHVE